jgi:mannose-6-phosphate isomerase-like protein (cupin superfamily)
MMFVVGAAIALSSSVQAQTGAAADPKLYTSAADVQAMMAKAKAERKPDQANFAQPLLKLGTYTASLESRLGLNAPATVHEKEAEVFYVVQGSGNVTTGGVLKEEKRTNADNLSGTGIEGGATRKIGAGDFFIVPEKVPHWFAPDAGGLVMMSLHVPR